MPAGVSHRRCVGVDGVFRTREGGVIITGMVAMAHSAIAIDLACRRLVGTVRRDVEMTRIVIRRVGDRGRGPVGGMSDAVLHIRHAIHRGHRQQGGGAKEDAE